MQARHTLRHPMLFGLTCVVAAVVSIPVRAENAVLSIGHPSVVVPAVPCVPQTAVTAAPEWFSDSSASSLPTSAAGPAFVDSATTDLPDNTAQYITSSLRPSFPLGDSEGVTAATLAGATLMLLGGWRWYRTTRLPWPPEPFEQDRLAMSSESGDHSAAGWRLSRFDDLPDSEPERPFRPLYDSLDDDVIDVVPLPPRH